ncbi:MAG TPA: MBL fold metallo-hydrolase [Candidatus Acidoferrum sp.]|nr:MBL fold metallo-hydrolase [Candidatus Acidoferrum sp.]
MAQRYTATKIGPELTVIDDDFVRMFLITGSERALLFDAGNPDGDLAAFVAELTALPVTVILSHAHGDHVGALEQFGKALLHRDEEPLLRQHYKDLPVEYVSDGQEFDLGGESVTAYHVPGHTPGGLVLLDKSRRRLYAGDMLSDLSLYMFMDHCSLKDFVASMDKLAALPFDEAYTSHGSLVIGRESVEGLRVVAAGVLDGSLKPEIEHKEFTDGETAKTARIGKYSMHIK